MYMSSVMHARGSLVDLSCNSNIGAKTWNNATQVHGTGFGNWNPSVIVQIQSSYIFRITRGCPLHLDIHTTAMKAPIILV